MLEGGEDPRFIARRMVILASEDVGNADPQALVVANAAAEAVDRVGLPECRLNLAQAAAYLALAPKSNASYRGIQRATAHVREHGAKPPPAYLRDAHYPGARKLGRGDRLRLPARRARRRRRPAGDPGRPRGRALLRAHRPRVRGGASTPARADPTPSRRARAQLRLGTARLVLRGSRRVRRNSMARSVFWPRAKEAGSFALTPNRASRSDHLHAARHHGGPRRDRRGPPARSARTSSAAGLVRGPSHRIGG